MSKTQVTHIAAIGIIYRASDPRQILMEVKDDGFPRPEAWRGLSFFGGNRFGPEAKEDNGPLDTLRRRIEGRLALTHQLEKPVKLEELAGIPPGEFVLKPNVIHEIRPADLEDLRELQKEIRENCAPLNSFLNREPAGGQALVTVFDCALSEPGWERLERLQQRFGNVSRLCPTVITSLDELSQTKTRSAFGINEALAHFWILFNYDLEEFSSEGSTIAEWLNQDPLLTYAEYDELYEFVPTANSPAR